MRMMKMNNIMDIKQKQPNCNIKISYQTVDWLVENTLVNKFHIDSETGEILGYQREPKNSHIKKIIDYILANPFYFPSCIVCSKPMPFTPNDNLLKTTNKTFFVVDGQHRIEAFRRMKNNPEYQEKYLEIMDCTIPIVILEDVDEKTEIDTFITINKTGKKVDTSLALILKNKITNLYKNKDTAKIDYLAVELARKINKDPNEIWNRMISFNEDARKTLRLLSLNAFVKAERRVIRMMNQLGLIQISSINNDTIDSVVDILHNVHKWTWNAVKEKWPSLFTNEGLQKSVIAGPIGFTSINKYIAKQITERNINNIELLKQHICEEIDNIKCPSKVWLKGHDFSTFSSESGYSKIVDFLEGKPSKSNKDAINIHGEVINSNIV